MITLGSTVRRLREASGLTQQGLASRVGVSASHISHIESDRRDPSVELLRRLAEAFSVWPGLLLGALLQAELPEEFRDLFEEAVESILETRHSDQLPLPLEGESSEMATLGDA